LVLSLNKQNKHFTSNKRDKHIILSFSINVLDILNNTYLIKKKLLIMKYRFLYIFVIIIVHIFKSKYNIV